MKFSDCDELGAVNLRGTGFELEGRRVLSRWELDIELGEFSRRLVELWTDNRFNHLVMPIAKDHLAVFLQPDGIVSVMQQRMMGGTQHNQVVSISLAAVDPVPYVVGIQVFAIAARGKAATLVSAFQRLQQERRDDSVPAAKFQEHPLDIRMYIQIGWTLK